MNEFNYLVAIALINQNEIRLMPIGGKAIKESIDSKKGPSEKGELIVLELCLRVLQLSIKSPIKLAAENKSLLLMEISMQNMQEKLPLFKKEWIRGGNSDNLIYNLSKNSSQIWHTEFVKYEGVKFNLLEKDAK